MKKHIIVENQSVAAYKFRNEVNKLIDFIYEQKFLSQYNHNLPIINITKQLNINFGMDIDIFMYVLRRQDGFYGGANYKYKKENNKNQTNKLESVTLFFIFPIQDTADLKTEYIRVRLVIYHELNHCIEKYYRSLYNKSRESTYIHYNDIMDLLSYNFKSIEDLNNFCKKNNYLYNFNSNLNIQDIRTLLDILITWFEDTELNARIASIYGELEGIQMTQNLSPFTKFDHNAVFLMSEVFRKQLSDIHTKPNLFNKENVLMLRQFFFNSFDTKSDNQFYNWFVKFLSKRIKETSKKVKNVVKLYNNTIDKAIDDQNKSTIHNSIEEVINYIKSPAAQLIKEEIDKSDIVYSDCYF